MGNDGIFGNKLLVKQLSLKTVYNASSLGFAFLWCTALQCYTVIHCFFFLLYCQYAICMIWVAAALAGVTLIDSQQIYTLLTLPVTYF